MIRNKRIIIFLLIISGICGIFVYRVFNIDNNKGSENKFTSKEDVIKDLEKNYFLFERVSEKIADQDGYFYADYIDNKLIIHTNIVSINQLDLDSRQELENAISSIITELKFIGVHKDEDSNYLRYVKEENRGGHAIIYSSNGNVPECGIIELIKQNWYYYVWQVE